MWVVFGVVASLAVPPVAARAGEATADTLRPPLGLLQPSARALLQPDDEDPPPRVDRTVVEKPVEKKRVEDDRPIYKTWWFWALTAAVVGGTVTAGVLTIKGSPAPPPLGCPPSTLACFGDGRTP